VRILLGKKAGNFKEATVLAFREAGVADISADVIGLFGSAVNSNKLRDEVDKSVKSAIQQRYCRQAPRHFPWHRLRNGSIGPTASHQVWCTLAHCASGHTTVHD
jgi:hypothetical protein